MDKPEEKDIVTKELAIANQTIRRLKGQIRGYQGLAARKTPEFRQDIPAIQPTEPASTVKTSEPTHFLGEWQHFCPNCGDESTALNPDFKDETICDPKKGGCGMHLGSMEAATKLKRCPSCGGKAATKLVKK